MTNRVLLGPNSSNTYGLYISKPGNDVLSAASANMIFDTRLGWYGSVVASGTATAPATISFPTMPYVPLVFVTLLNGTTVTGSQLYTYNKGVYTSGVSQGDQYVQLPYYSVTTNSLSIIQPSWFTNSASNIQNYSVRYIIWRCIGT